jgi:hypothetical protein
LWLRNSNKSDKNKQMTINMMMDQRPQYSGAAHHPASATAPKTSHKPMSARPNAAPAANKKHKPSKLSMPVQKQRSAPPPHSAPVGVVENYVQSGQPKKIDLQELFSMSTSRSDGELSNKNEHTSINSVVKRPLAERQRAHTSARVPQPLGTPPKTTTMGAFATPAYADSPSARELPPPPTDWLSRATIETITKPARAQTMPFTGVEFLRVVANQC